MDHTIILSGAIVSHQTWMANLQTFIKGGSNLTDMQVSSPDDCNLGKWLKGDGLREFGEYPEFAELEKLHRTLHGLGKEVVKNKHAGDTIEAERLIDAMGPISKQIVATIEKLKMIASLK